LEAEKSVEKFLREKNPEARLLIRIFAIIGFVVILLLLAGFIYLKIKVPQLLEFSKGITEINITVKADSLENSLFVEGMKGCENICLPADTRGFYISSLDGMLTFLSGQPGQSPSVQKSFKAGTAVMGVSVDVRGELVAAVCTISSEEPGSWDAGLYRVNKDMSELERISQDFPSMNGICFDGAGNLYFTSSNFNYLSPEGAIYRMERTDSISFMPPEVLIAGIGLANGLYFDGLQDKIYFSNTIGGVYSFTPGIPDYREEYLKTRFMEACDDLCTDSGGNIWMTDPGNSTVKMYNPGTNRLVRYTIIGLGQASSCRIRVEDGLDILYITELKTSTQPLSEDFNGRGVFIVPAYSLIRLLEPYLIN
jgi:sugar lactone lactonase YvrE